MDISEAAGEGDRHTGFQFQAAVQAAAENADNAEDDMTFATLIGGSKMLESVPVEYMSCGELS